MTFEEKILATFEEALKLAEQIGFTEGYSGYPAEPQDPEVVALMQMKEDLIKLVRSHREAVLNEAADALAEHFDTHTFVKFEAPDFTPYDPSKPLFVKRVTSPQATVALVRNLVRKEIP